VSRELVAIAGDGIGREVIPLAVQCLREVIPALRVIYAEAGHGQMRRVGVPLDPHVLHLLTQVGSAIMGPEADFSPGQPGATAQLVQALDLYLALYPLVDAARGIDLLLCVGEGESRGGQDPRTVQLTPAETWAATRVGNMAGLLASQRKGMVTIAHESEEPFVHAVRAGVGDVASVERVDAVWLVNQFPEMARELDVVVASASTGALLTPYLVEGASTPHGLGHLLLGPRACVARPVHGPLMEEVEWGFSNPLGAIRAAVALLRYGWMEEAAAARLERSIQLATARRRTPDMGGLNTMFELTRAVLRELQHGS
jgi:homoisocitrate dehydrogenase